MAVSRGSMSSQLAGGKKKAPKKAPAPPGGYDDAADTMGTGAAPAGFKKGGKVGCYKKGGRVKAKKKK